MKFAGSYSAGEARKRARWRERCTESAQAMDKAVRETRIAIDGGTAARSQDMETITARCTRAGGDALMEAWRRATGAPLGHATEQTLKKIARDAATRWVRAAATPAQWARGLVKCRTRARGTGRETLGAHRVAALGRCDAIDWKQVAKAPAWGRAMALEEVEPGLLALAWKEWVAEWANMRCRAEYAIAGIADAKSMSKALAKWEGRRSRPPIEQVALGAVPCRRDPHAWWAAAVRARAKGAEDAQGGRTAGLAEVERRTREERALVARQIEARAQAWCGGPRERPQGKLETIAWCWDEAGWPDSASWRQCMRLVERSDATLAWEIPYTGPEPVLAASITGRGAAAEMAVSRALLWPLCEEAFIAEGWKSVRRRELDREAGGADAAGARTRIRMTKETRVKKVAKAFVRAVMRGMEEEGRVGASSRARTAAQLEAWGAREAARLTRYAGEAPIALGACTEERGGHRRRSVASMGATHAVMQVRSTLYGALGQMEREALRHARDRLWDTQGEVERALADRMDTAALERARASVEKTMEKLDSAPAHPKERWKTQTRNIVRAACMEGQTWKALGAAPPWLAREAFTRLGPGRLEDERGRWYTRVAQAHGAGGDEEPQTRERRLIQALRHWGWPRCTPPLRCLEAIAREAGPPRGDGAWAAAVVCAQGATEDKRVSQWGARWSDEAWRTRGRLEAWGQRRALEALESMAGAHAQVGLEMLKAIDMWLKTPERRAQTRPRVERVAHETGVGWYIEHAGASEVLATEPRNPEAAGREYGEWEGRYAEISACPGRTGPLGRERREGTSRRWALASAMEDAIARSIGCA